MKNFIVLILIIWAAWYFYDISKNNESIKKAKKEMWIIDDTETDKLENKNKTTQKKEKNIAKPDYSISKFDNKNFIEIDDLESKVEKITEKIKITWKVLNKDVDKIIINFKNASSDFPNDRYELNKFKKWDESFEYNANAKTFRNIDYWNNEYLIESYVWNDISKIQLNINIPENLWEQDENNDIASEKITYDKKMIWNSSSSSYLGMPVSNSFWKPLSLWDWKITYSNISWLVIKKENFSASELKIEDIWKSDSSWYLNKNLDSSYIYWNSYRNIDNSKKDSWISFYVLRKNQNQYIYEKYYFDFKHSLKWILEIKKFDSRGESVSVEMSELNDKLKKENENFEIVKITDKLFKEIVR